MTLYNLANGVMFCFLAGSMITVSATAVGVWFDFPMPGLERPAIPTASAGCWPCWSWGRLISIVAAYGYETVSKIANIAAPWMVLVFLAFGLVGLRAVHRRPPDAEIHSLGDLWHLAKTSIWKGGEPLPGQVKFTFWHVMFFAWFCNMAMHIGMSDLSVFRFARKSWYGVGDGGRHVRGPLHGLDRRLDALRAAAAARPGQHGRPARPAGLQGGGVAGLVCVIVAGWTTANPTIYRAGLAFQAIVPRTSRFTVTLLDRRVGDRGRDVSRDRDASCSDFVALYGMVLMPMGAVIFVDFYLLKRFGLRSDYAEWSRRSFNWAAGLTWFLTLGTCVAPGQVRRHRRSTSSVCPAGSSPPRFTSF